MIALPFEYILLFIGFLIIIVLVMLYKTRDQSQSNQIDNIKVLRNEYIILHGGFSREAASQALDRQINLLQKKHPNMPNKWYYEKALHDIKRDKRL